LRNNFENKLKILQKKLKHSHENKRFSDELAKILSTPHDEENPFNNEEGTMNSGRSNISFNTN